MSSSRDTTSGNEAHDPDRPDAHKRPRSSMATQSPSASHFVTNAMAPFHQIPALFPPASTAPAPYNITMPFQRPPTADPLNVTHIVMTDRRARSGPVARERRWKNMLHVLVKDDCGTLQLFQQRHSLDYSWEKLLALLQTHMPRFDDEQDCVIIVLKHRGELVRQETVQYAGELSCAMDVMLRSARERPGAGATDTDFEMELTTADITSYQSSQTEESQPAVQHAPQEERAPSTAATTDSADVPAEEGVAPLPADKDPVADDAVVILDDSDDDTDGRHGSKAAEENNNNNRDEMSNIEEDNADGRQGNEDLHSTEESKINSMLPDTVEDEAGWTEACVWFDHDRNFVTLAPEHCRRLPGTKRALRPHQLFDVWRYFSLVANNDDQCGALLAHSMGVGKTIICYAIIALRRLVVLSLEH